MKKYLSVLLALCLLCVCAAGCAEKGDTQEENGILDLTKLSGTLVYAEVYNIMSSPDDYIGRTIKMSGPYTANYYEPTQKYYHSVIIEDAAACCAQGLEFEWKGEHSYPGDYPENGAKVEVTGVFGSYEELGQTYYCLTVDGITVLG